MRAFQMQPDDARHPFGDGVDSGLDGGFGLLGRVGDQCGQQRRDTGAAMRLSHAPQGRQIGAVVEHHPAATVDLKIDEAGAKHAARHRLRHDALRHLFGGEDAAAAVLHLRQHHAAVQPRAVVDLRPGENLCDLAHH